MELQRIDSAVILRRAETWLAMYGDPKDSLPTANATAKDVKPSAMAETQQTESSPTSRLLNLPTELLLLILECTVIEASPLLINGPCDSSFGGWNAEYYADKALWDSGQKTSPPQPSITRVCRFLRAEALPIFYRHNRFQSGYCYETDVDMTLNWLRRIGEVNRRLLEDFYFFDANWRHDVYVGRDLKKLQRGPVVKEMGGVMRSSYSYEGCRHEIVFGREGEHEAFEDLALLFEE